MEAQSIRRVLVDMFVLVDRTKYVLLVVSIRPIVFTSIMFSLIYLLQSAHAEAQGIAQTVFASHFRVRR